MDNTVITLLSSLVSGLVGVLIGTWLNRYYEERKEKVKILKTLILKNLCFFKKHYNLPIKNIFLYLDNFL